ncbi:MAG: hypothetical protein ACXWOL_03315 [Ktedonobacteraceae bacterium]
MSTTYYADENLVSLQENTRVNNYARSSSNAHSGTVCEILLVTLESNQVLFLHGPTESQNGTWLVPHLPGIHPNQTVLQHLITFFGDLFEPDTSIVHSTSWRYNCQIERLILTYLVVLPYRVWMHQWAAAGCISIKRLGAIEKVQGNNLFPPDKIERDEIIARALDHLALLSRDDRSIQSVLEPGWMDVLRIRLPRPAGLVQTVQSNSQLLQDLTSANFSRTNNTSRNSRSMIVNQ